MKRILTLCTLLACDIVPVPEPTPPPPAGCGEEFQMFGPCGPGLTCAADDLGCVVLESGSVCLPLTAEPTSDVRACAAHLGALSCSSQAGMCAVVCPSGSHAECGDMLCDEHLVCVWPGVPLESSSTGGQTSEAHNPTGTT